MLAGCKMLRQCLVSYSNSCVFQYLCIYFCQCPSIPRSVHHTGIVYLMMLRCHVSSKHLVPNDQANKSFPLLLMFHYNGECQPHFIIFRFLYFHQELLFIFFTVFISTCQEAFFFLIIICKNNIILPAAKTFWFVRFFL